MAIIAKSTGESSQRELIPAGTYVARCYSVIHLGHVVQKYMGEEKVVDLVRFTWELPTELRCFNQDKGEQPCAISKEMTLSLNEKSNLRGMINAWRGKALTEKQAEAFDIAKLIGQPCMLNIIHQAGKTNPERIYERIAAVMPMMKGMVCPPQVNPSMEFSVLEFDRAKFMSMPTFLQEMISTSKEYIQMMQAPAAPVRTGYEDKIGHVVTNATEQRMNAQTVDEVDDLPF